MTGVCLMEPICLDNMGLELQARHRPSRGEEGREEDWSEGEREMRDEYKGTGDEKQRNERWEMKTKEPENGKWK